MAVLYLGNQEVTPIITIERKNKYGYNGHIDVAGLRELGWDDEDLGWLQGHCWWNEEDDEYWKVSEANKTKGKLITWSNWRQTYYQDRDIRFFPKLTTPTITACFNNSYHLVAIPTHGWDLGSIKNWGNFAANAYSLRSVGDFADAIHEGLTSVNIMFTNTYSLIDLGDISK